MPKYLVEMHDGRKFQVEADSPPSEAEVLSHLGQQPKALPIGAPSEPGTYQGGFAKSVRDTVSKTGQGILEGLNPLPALQSIWQGGTDSLPYKPEDTPETAMARLKANDPKSSGSALDAVKGLSDPETGGRAIGNLLQAGAVGRLVTGAKNPAVRGSVGRAMQTVGDNVDVTKPLKMLSTAGRALEQSAQPSAPSPTAPAGPHMDLSRPIQAGGLTPQQIAERVNAVTQAGGTSIPPAAPKGPLGGRLMTQAPPEAAVPPVTAPQPVAPQPQPPAPGPMESPLQQPRTQVGAEVVGRQNGMSTQQVRDTTGPIRGEAPGTAAGMPTRPMDRIVQKLIDMGPKGQGLPESAREGYAAGATSDKARLQIQAYLDALRKVGYAVPIGAAGLQRDSIMRMMASHDPQQ